MAATQRDVAARAGVSPVVVSRVLHNKARSVRVSQATADRVRQAAQELNYKLNVSARNFRQQQTQTIGILHGAGFEPVEFGGDSRYFSILMDGMVEGAFANGYALTLCPKLLGNDPADAMSDGRFDGLVWYSTVTSETSLKIVSECSVPLVVIHAHGADVGFARPTVICDNDQGIRLAVEHLTALGHQSIAFAYDGDTPNSEALERVHHFRRHMAALDLPREDTDILYMDAARNDVEAFLLGPQRHTAVICRNESLAGVFVSKAPSFGVRVPGDLSVVGFDSTSFCNEFQPRLTCVSQPLREMGRTAIELLVQLMRDDSSANREVILPCGFDVRGSTGPAGAYK
jgi:LacI family transcriptional regulator